MAHLMTARSGKRGDAYLTIRELSDELGVATHILRFWESKFPALKPLKRGGNRRYYRPGDVRLVKALNHLLNVEGYTVKGVQKLLAEHGTGEVIAKQEETLELMTGRAVAESALRETLERMRDRLRAALS